MALLVGAAFGAYVWWGLPPRAEVRALARTTPEITGVMRQRQEEAQQKGRKARRVQSYVPLSRVSRSLIQAVVASEDQRFFGHEGVDWAAIQKSVEVNAQKGRYARGGSTITQQLAKNLFFSTRKSLTRKAREFVVAMWLEQDLSKPRILELYLNLIEWGDGIYGCQAAALAYYGKPASALDETEAAGLVAMIPNPRRINPTVNATRHARAQRRVLWLMAHAGYLRGNVRGLGTEPPTPEPVDEEEPPDTLAPPETTASPEVVASPDIVVPEETPSPTDSPNDPGRRP